MMLLMNQSYPSYTSILSCYSYPETIPTILTGQIALRHYLIAQLSLTILGVPSILWSGYYIHLLSLE
jgi:hypothetical protein